MKINWKIRWQNKAFWLGLIPAAVLAVQSVTALLGVELPAEWSAEKAVQTVDAVFALLAVLGVVTDPTTEGLGDSERALAYEMPGKTDGGEA